MKLCEKDTDCDAVVCDSYLIFQKHDEFVNDIYTWLDKNGMFYWMCPRVIVDNFTLRMYVQFINNDIVVHEDRINISEMFKKQTCSLPTLSERVKMQIMLQDGDDSRTC